MPQPVTAPYGSWASPVSARLLTDAGVRLASPRLHQGQCYWLESRPAEQGRSLIMRLGATGPEEVTPADFNVRAKANEYGGGDYCLADQTLFFVNAGDQQVYRQALTGGQPQALTRAPQSRFADLVFDPERQQLIAIEEKFEAGQAESRHRLVAIDADSGALTALASGEDFYASPALSPDGRQLSWLSWNHPNMPWDENHCWLAQLDRSGVSQVRCISPAGSSSFQPQFSPDNQLWLVNDQSGWWNLHRLVGDQLENVLALDAEFATPQWLFGMSCYGFPGQGRLLALFTRDGSWQAGLLNLHDNQLDVLDWPFSDISGLHTRNGQAVLLAASPTQASAVWHWQQADGSLTCGRQSLATPLAPAIISRARAICFDTTDNGQAHGFYYPPCNPAYVAPAGEKPPLMVLSHGGPTGATESSLNIKIQYWTSRGFAVLDVNYRGSTGYGRDYREALRGRWGMRDVDDVCAGAQHLVQQGLADPDRLIIKGSSAGGYTVLAALAYRDTFRAGTSLYGIGDLTALARDTHKFESRYLDGLVAPWPEGEAEYIARSPLNCPENIQCPVIFFQGLKDKVVPPEQAYAMHDALRRQGISTALITFPDEGHGFRQAQSIIDQLELELNFYGRVFGIAVVPERSDRVLEEKQ